MPITLNGTTGIILSGSAGLSSTGDGEVTLNNTLDVQSGGTGANSLIGIVKGDGSNALTAGKVNLLTEVSGTLNVASGGTGLTSPGVSGNVIVSDGTNFVSRTPRLNTVAISANTTATPGNYYVATSNLNLTLPAAASTVVGDLVGLSNASGNTNLTIFRNSANIMGVAEDLIVDAANVALVLQYSGATKGWVFA